MPILKGMIEALLSPQVRRSDFQQVCRARLRPGVLWSSVGLATSLDLLGSLERLTERLKGVA